MFLMLSIALEIRPLYHNSHWKFNEEVLGLYFEFSHYIQSPTQLLRPRLLVLSRQLSGSAFQKAHRPLINKKEKKK